MPEPAISFPAPDSGWQQALREAYRDPRALLADLSINPEAIDWLANSSFAMKVPRGYAARMRRGDPQDPLLLQVLPRQLELQRIDGFVDEPLQEKDFQPSPGLIQKYHGRALLITTASCGVHCRYCFRRHFDYRSAGADITAWQQALAQINRDSSIEEIILSGGDPLSLSDDKLNSLFSRLEKISHIRRLRIHTRQAIVLPERITDALASRLSQSRLQVVFVVHANHAQELDHNVAAACHKLKRNGATLLNQAVLLKDVNASVQAQEALALRLFEIGVLPYYLHQLDPVNGAAHFELADQDARGIMRELNARLPGYLVPRLVRELPGQDGKMPLNWASTQGR